MPDYGLFLGTGTSQGVPVINCTCPVCTSLDFRNKRLRTSFYLNVGDVSIVVDPGPDFRQQMLRHGIARIDALIVTHEHKDHIGGLDDIRAYNFFQHESIPVYAFSRTLNAIRRDFSYIFSDNKYPGLPQLTLEPTDGDSFIIKGVEFQIIRVMHARMEVMGLRIGDFTYITDANFISEENLRKVAGSRHIVLNALQKEPHISHFTLEEAVKLARDLKPEHAYFTHISHKLGLHGEVNASLPSGIQLAYDGLRLAL